MKTKVILVTCPSPNDAVKLSEGIVAAGLAACVNIVPAIQSIYRWEGKLENSSESLLVIKTRASKLPLLEQFIHANHPYSTPEFIVLDTEHVSSKYAEWVKLVTE